MRSLHKSSFWTAPYIRAELPMAHNWPLAALRLGSFCEGGCIGPRVGSKSVRRTLRENGSPNLAKLHSSSQIHLPLILKRLSKFMA